MASIIKLKRNNTASVVPSGGDLAAGELAVNTADGLLFSSSDGTDIVSLGQTAANIQASAALGNTNSYIASVQTDVDNNEAAELVRLSNTNAYIATKASEANSLLRLSNTNAYIATKASEASAAANTYVNILLSNTNAYIAAVQADVDANETTAATAVSNLVDGTTAFTDIDVNGGNIDDAIIATSDITVGSGKTLDVSAGTLTLAANQISGDKVDGGTISDFASIGIDDNATSTKITVADATTTISNDLAVSGALTVDGNLTIEGTVTYIGTTTVNVEDSMMKLSANNAADAIDTGVYGKYVDGTTKYAGYFRDATDGTVKFFTDLEVEPTSTVNTGGTGYALATIEAVIDGGSF